MVLKYISVLIQSFLLIRQKRSFCLSLFIIRSSINVKIKKISKKENISLSFTFILFFLIYLFFCSLFSVSCLDQHEQLVKMLKYSSKILCFLSDISVCMVHVLYMHLFASTYVCILMSLYKYLNKKKLFVYCWKKF